MAHGLAMAAIALLYAGGMVYELGRRHGWAEAVKAHDPSPPRRLGDARYTGL